jgi:hypothetical protein
LSETRIRGVRFGEEGTDKRGGGGEQRRDIDGSRLGGRAGDGRTTTMVELGAMRELARGGRSTTATPGMVYYRR